MRGNEPDSLSRFRCDPEITDHAQFQHICLFPVAQETIPLRLRVHDKRWAGGAGSGPRLPPASVSHHMWEDSWHTAQGQLVFNKIWCNVLFQIHFEYLHFLGYDLSLDVPRSCICRQSSVSSLHRWVLWYTQRRCKKYLNGKWWKNIHFCSPRLVEVCSWAADCKGHNTLLWYLLHCTGEETSMIFLHWSKTF